MTAAPTQSECIRDLTAEDNRAVAKLARHAFPATQSSFVYPGKTGTVATVNGTLVAACLVRVLRLPGGGRVGFVAWLMTHPDFRGRGLARKVVDAATRDLKADGCETLVTDIEGYNTASSNTFLRSGYGRVSFGQQLRRWNAVDLLWVWIRTGLVLDPGHFLWVTEPEAAKPHPVCGWLFSVGLNTLLVFNTLIAVAPFEGFHGRHLRDFNSWIWLLMSLLALLVFVWA